MNSRTCGHLIEDYLLRGASLVKISLFFGRHLEARTAGCHNLDRRAAPWYNCHISASASHIELCALSRNEPLRVRMAVYSHLMCFTSASPTPSYSHGGDPVSSLMQGSNAGVLKRLFSRSYSPSVFAGVMRSHWLSEERFISLPVHPCTRATIMEIR